MTRYIMRHMNRILLAALTLAAVLVLTACNRAPSHYVDGAYDGCDCVNLAKSIAWSLDHEPDEWDFDGHEPGYDHGTYRVWVDPWKVSAGPGFDGHGQGYSFDDENGDMIRRAFRRWMIIRVKKA